MTNTYFLDEDVTKHYNDLNKAIEGIHVRKRDLNPGLLDEKPVISPTVIKKVDMMVEESRSFRFRGPLNLEQGQMQTRQMERGW